MIPKKEKMFGMAKRRRRFDVSVLVMPIVLGLLAFAPATEASGPCTQRELEISDRYYAADGSRLPGVTGPRPKKCQRGTVERGLSCPKPGGPPAVDFLLSNLVPIRAAALYSRNVYQRSAALDGLPPSSDGDYLYLGPSEIIEPRKEISLPPRGDNEIHVWKHVPSGLVVQLVRLPPWAGRSRDVMVVAFRGTVGVADWENNLLQEPVVSPVFEISRQMTRKMVETAIYGEIPEFKPGSSLPPMYREAGEVAAAINRSRIRSCDHSVLYTGHSLGGALAVQAAFAEVRPSNCSGGLDSLLTFNAATNHYENVRALNPNRTNVTHHSIGLYASFYATGDPINVFSRSAIPSQLRRARRGAQTVWFPDVDVGFRCDIPIDDRISSPALHALHATNDLLCRHGMGNMFAAIESLGEGLASESEACEWYRPL